MSREVIAVVGEEEGDDGGCSDAGGEGGWRSRCQWQIRWRRRAAGYAVEVVEEDD
jgi:hypothetical protein